MANTGLTGSMQTVGSGDGVDSPLQLSTGGVKSAGTLEVDGTTTLGGNVLMTALASSTPDALQVVIIDTADGRLYRLPTSVFSGTIPPCDIEAIPAANLWIPSGLTGTIAAYTGWTDKGTAGDDLTATGTVVPNIANGRVMVEIPNGGLFSATLGVAMPQPFTFVCAAQSASLDTGNFLSYSTDLIFEFFGPSSLGVNAGGTSAAVTTPDEWRVVRVDFDGANSRIYFDGDPVGTAIAAIGTNGLGTGSATQLFANSSSSQDPSFGGAAIYDGIISADQWSVIAGALRRLIP